MIDGANPLPGKNRRPGGALIVVRLMPVIILVPWPKPERFNSLLPCGAFPHRNGGIPPRIPYLTARAKGYTMVSGPCPKRNPTPLSADGHGFVVLMPG